MDTDLKSIISPFVKKAHPIVKSFITSGDLEDTIGEIAENYNLNESEISDLNDLVCMILVGIENPDKLFDEVPKITGLPQNLADDLSVAIQNIVLSTLASKIEAGTTRSQPQNNIGNSFEQIILNQAKAMRPARPAGGIQNPEAGIQGKTNAPTNLPTEENSKPKISVPNYSGNDPYREQI